jgi:hypothetical protein
MRLKYYLSIVLFLLCSSILYAEDWYQGSLVLKSQETLKGEIAIHLDHDVVLYRKGDVFAVIPAHKVKSFYIYDEEQESNRQFISLQQTLGAATVHRLYEVLLDGHVKILRKQQTAWYSIHFDAIEFDYFIAKDDELTALHKFRRKVFPGMVRTSSDNFQTFIHKNKLSVHRLDDLIRIIDHYNQQYVSSDQLAKN